ncbi:hypothetical protein KKB44_05880 [Candidatus Micrarchaeota archaeon]|nr:hypothetical protein [Candidatus Micrarchaeota archaeon]
MTKLKPRKPKKIPPSRKVICASLLLGAIHLLAFVLVLVSGTVIILQYVNIIFGTLPSEIQKVQLDYSLSIFGASALYLLVYAYEAEKLVKKIFRVKNVRN